MFERRSDLVKFLTVVETGKIVAAADKLAITQPALTRAISRIERECGGRLFERIPTGVRLTQLGSIVASRARRIMNEIDDGKEYVEAAIAGRAGRFRVSASPIWMQAFVIPAAAAFHEAFPDVELKLKTGGWRKGIRLLSHGSSDLYCGGVDAGDVLPQYLRRERFLDVTSGIVAHRDHPLHAGKIDPGDLTRYPWIDLEGPSSLAFEGKPSLANVLDELHDQTGIRTRAVVRAGIAGFLLMSTGPWLAWLPLELLEQLPGVPIKPLPLAFGQHQYRAGLVIRRSAADFKPFSNLVNTIRSVALKSRR